MAADTISPLTNDRAFACQAALAKDVQTVADRAQVARWLPAEINSALYSLTWDRLMVDLEPHIEQAEVMLRNLGQPPELTPRPWLAWWLMVPHPTLDGSRPLDLLHTEDGRRRVMDALTQWISGVHT